MDRVDEQIDDLIDSDSFVLPVDTLEGEISAPVGKLVSGIK